MAGKSALGLVQYFEFCRFAGGGGDGRLIPAWTGMAVSESFAVPGYKKAALGRLCGQQLVLGRLFASELDERPLLDRLPNGLHQIRQRCGFQLLKVFNVEFCGSHTSFL